MTNEQDVELDANLEVGDDANAFTGRALEMVKAQATARPLVALGVATGVGFVLGGGLPRIGMLLGLGVTGVALGFGLPRMLRGSAQDDEGEDDSDADTSTSGMPMPEGTATRPARKRRRSKRKNASAGAG